MHAVLMVTDKDSCNANCSHCYVAYTGSRSPESTLDAVIKLQENGHSVVIAGTENLLNPHYLKAYQEAKQRYVLTNGIVLDQNPSLYEVLRKHEIEEITVSLHFGIQKQLNSVPEQLVARVVKASVNEGFKANLLVTISNENYSMIEHMCEKATEYGATGLDLVRFISTGSGESMGDSCLTNNQIAEVFIQVKEMRTRYTKEQLYIKTRGNFGPPPGPKGDLLVEHNCYCPAGINMVAIDPHDLVYSCQWTMGEGKVIGNYKDGQIILDKTLFPNKRSGCIIDLVNNSSSE